jgi:hypothetical protein
LIELEGELATGREAVKKDEHTFGLVRVSLVTVGRVHALVLILWSGTADKNRVVCMSLDMLLQILRPLERLAAKVTLVRL